MSKANDPSLLKRIGTALWPSRFRHSDDTNSQDRPANAPRGGRETEPDHRSTLGTLNKMISGETIVDPEFNEKFIEAIEHLAMHNENVSNALDNNVTLANTDFQIEFVEGVSDDMQEEMKAVLSERMDSWYNYSEGVRSLIGDLLTQVSLTGAVSGEWVPFRDLSGIRQVERVSPKNIRFKYDKQEERFVPMQKVARPGEQAPSGYITLNETTYNYIAHRRIKESPYGVPPFLSAMQSVATQINMNESMDFIMKKYGLLGFLQAMVSRPQRKNGETNEQYEQRCQQYLSEIHDELEKSLKKGVVAGFQKEHEIEHTPLGTNAQGASDIFKLNDLGVMSGLKQDPQMMGRERSSGETFGRVILAKMGEQLGEYQRVVGAFLRNGFNLELYLHGYGWNLVKSVTFDDPMVSDRKRNEQVFSVKIRNANMLYEAGIISQTERAQMLGYDEPDQEEPRASSSEGPPNADDDPDDPTNTDPGTTEDNNKKFEDMTYTERMQVLEKAQNKLNGKDPEFPYHHHDH